MEALDLQFKGNCRHCGDVNSLVVIEKPDCDEIHCLTCKKLNLRMHYDNGDLK